MRSKGTKRLILSAGIAGSLFWGSAANALTISIGLQESGVNLGAITLVGSGDGFAGFLGTYGDFSNNISGTGLDILSLPSLLNTNTINTSNNATASKTLQVYVTEQGLSASTPLTPFLSTLTSNVLSAGGSVTMATFFDNSNVLWGTSSPLSSDTFTSLGTFSEWQNGAADSEYSLTALYTITVGAHGSATSTIDVATTPIPAALPLFASVLGGGLVFRRLRKRNKVAA